MARRWLASCGALCFLPLLTASNCGPKPPPEPTDEVVDVPTYDEALALVAEARAEHGIVASDPGQTACIGA